MRRIVHHELGEPARVLLGEDCPSEPLGPDQVRVSVSYAPIHPGDLLRVTGSPAFGTIGAGAVALAFAREALATRHEWVDFGYH
jgi:NADPH:quinone reductase-like Zn-dependent oxidoreductase